VLILGGSVSQLPAIRHARAAGLRVVVADGDDRALGFDEADVAELIDFSDVDALVAVARRHHVDGLAAICSDRAVAVAAAAAERLDLPGIGTEVAHRMTDKGAMREQLAKHDVPQPSFAVVRTLEEAATALVELGTPAVLKPVDSGGQRGVFRIERSGDLAKFLPRTLAFSHNRSAMLEQFIDGEELNGIAVARGGEVSMLTLSDRLRPPGVGFGVGWIHRYPSSLARAAVSKASSVAARAVQALGLRDGVAFPQLLVCNGEAFVVEVAARVPAGQMADLVYHVQLGDTRPVVIRFFTAEPGILPTGRVVGIDGLEQVREAPGVLDADLYLQVGETIRAVQVDADRRGYVVATGADADAALASANAAMRRLVVRTERPERPFGATLPRGVGELPFDDAASWNA
jgi:biotin carboxylase